jgi:hypothetical protein
MALGAFVAGRYSTAFGSDDLGITKEGYKLTFRAKSKKIDKTDVIAESVFDLLNAGGDWSLQCDSLEYKSGPLFALTQFNQGGTLGQLGAIGQAASDDAESLVMTVTAGTAAALNGGAINTLTAASAIITPDADITLLFDSVLREFPIKLQFLPFAVDNVIKHFLTS